MYAYYLTEPNAVEFGQKSSLHIGTRGNGHKGVVQLELLE